MSETHPEIAYRCRRCGNRDESFAGALPDCSAGCGFPMVPEDPAEIVRLIIGRTYELPWMPRVGDLRLLGQELRDRFRDRPLLAHRPIARVTGLDEDGEPEVEWLSDPEPGDELHLTHVGPTQGEVVAKEMKRHVRGLEALATGLARRDDSGGRIIQAETAGIRRLVALLERPRGEPIAGRLEAVLEDVIRWAEETFGEDGPPAPKARHLLKEAEELADDPCDPEEMADVLIILAHLAHVCDVDLAEEVARKLEINRGREWGEEDEDGVIEHVSEDEGGG